MDVHEHGPHEGACVAPTNDERTPRKLVVYLDQCYLSNMAQAAFGAKRSDPKYSIFGQLFETARRLVVDDKAIFPESMVHGSEADLAENSRALIRKVTGSLAWGLRLRSPDQIMTAQLTKGLIQWYGRDPDPPLRDWGEAFKRDPQEAISNRSTKAWDSEVLVTVDWPPSGEEVREQKRRRPERTAELERIRQECVDRKITYDTQLEEERLAAIGWTCLYPTFVRMYAAALELVWKGKSPDEPLDEQLVKNVAMDLVGPNSLDWLVSRLAQLRITPQRAFSFLMSHQAKLLPYFDIQSRLWASVVTDRDRRVQPGDANDIEAISTALPYCHVLTCDSYFSGLVTKHRKKSPSIVEDYGLQRVFAGTPRDAEAFLSLLKAL